MSGMGRKNETCIHKNRKNRKALWLLLLALCVLLAAGGCGKKKDPDVAAQTAAADAGAGQDTADGAQGTGEPAGTSPDGEDGSKTAGDEAQDGEAAGDEAQDGEASGEAAGDETQDGEASGGTPGEGAQDGNADGEAAGDQGTGEGTSTLPEEKETQRRTVKKAAGSIQAGFNAIEAADYDGAVSFFNTALANKEKDRAIYRGRGIAYMGLGQFEDAVADFTRYFSLSTGRVDSADYDVNYYLGTAYYKLGRFEDAADTFGAVLSMKPKDKQALFLRGSAKLAQGDQEGAAADFDAIVELAPDDYDIKIALYRCLSDAGLQEQGMAYLQNALSEDNKKISDFDRGRISYYVGDYKNARTYLEKSKDSGGVEAVLLLGKTYEQLEDYKYAASIYTSYLSEEGGNVSVYNQLAMCRLKDEDYQGALEALQRGLESADGALKQTMLYNEAIVYEKLGQFSDAATVMGQYVSANPEDEEAAREYEFLQNR